MFVIRCRTLHIQKLFRLHFKKHVTLNTFCKDQLSAVKLSNLYGLHFPCRDFKLYLQYSKCKQVILKQMYSTNHLSSKPIQVHDSWFPMHCLQVLEEQVLEQHNASQCFHLQFFEAVFLSETR